MDKGSIAFFQTYRPPVPLDIYSCPIAGDSITKADETPMITEERNTFANNYNATPIPPNSLEKLVTRSGLASKGIYKVEDVGSGRLSGLIFVSERGEFHLEILHIALRLDDKFEVFTLAEIFGTADFNGVRMEDSCCFTDDYLVYVSTKTVIGEPRPKRRQPWTVVYRTHLITGKTDRLTPPGQADLSPSVSKSGKMIAVASFQRRTEEESGWMGEIEDLRTYIYAFDIDNPTQRKLVVENGGWPTWGSDSVLFFHRNVNTDPKKPPLWGVFRFKADIQKIINNGAVADVSSIQRVLPTQIGGVAVGARTPAAIDENRVAVATIRLAFDRNDLVNPRTGDQYRHIEIFEYSEAGKQVEPIQLTASIGLMADQYNPFVICDAITGTKRIGYHRVNIDILDKNGGDLPRQFHKLESPDPKLGLFRVPGVFPTFSRDGKKLAFVDNEFKSVWVADENGLHVVHKTEVNFFAPVWNQGEGKDILYVCEGLAFSASNVVHIIAIKNTSGAGKPDHERLTKGANNACPSTNPDGTKLVYRSTRDFQGDGPKHKNLYIMEDAEVGEFGKKKKELRITNGPHTDTHCQWSPRGDWIVFSSTRDKPPGTPDLDNGIDPGHFVIYLVNAQKPNVVVRVARCGDGFAGHINHPFFSPEGNNIVVTADLAAVSCDPVSLPLFVHSVRPYGDIFTIDIDNTDMKKNEDTQNFKRITHSRYECSTASWTRYKTTDPHAAWNMQLGSSEEHTPSFPHAHSCGSESWHMTGHPLLGHSRGC